MARLKLQSPWIIYYEELEMFFEDDPDVRVIFDEAENTVNVYVAEPDKAEAISRLIPAEKVFGNVTLYINIIPGNPAKNSALADIRTAFRNNPIVNDIHTVNGILTNPFTYVIFRKEVVQYWNDDLGDAYGNCTTLWQDVAKRLFGEVPGIYFCTDEHETVDIEYDEDEITFLL